MTDYTELINTYVAGPQLLRHAVSGLSREQFTARPVAGKWSTLEVVCPVSDCEQFFAERMKQTLAMSRPLLLGRTAGCTPADLIAGIVTEKGIIQPVTEEDTCRCLTA